MKKYCYLYIVIIFCCGCTDKNLVETTVYDSLAFSYPNSFVEATEKTIDTVFFDDLKDGRPKYFFHSKEINNSVYPYYQYVYNKSFIIGGNIPPYCTIEELGNSIIKSFEKDYLNKKISIIEWSKDKITTSYTRDDIGWKRDMITESYTRADSGYLYFQLASFFIVDNKLYCLEYNAYNTKENIDTISPYIIMKTIKKK